MAAAVVVVEQTKAPAVLVRRASTAEPRRRMQARISARVAAADLLPDRLVVLVVTDQPISVLPTPVAVAVDSSLALAQLVVPAAAARAEIRPEQPERLTPEAVAVALEVFIQRAAALAAPADPESWCSGIPDRRRSVLAAPLACLAIT
jgi:hypothetical protein